MQISSALCKKACTGCVAEVGEEMEAKELEKDVRLRVRNALLLGVTIVLRVMEDGG